MSPDMHTSHQRSLGPLSLSLAVLAATAGCSLSDYEKAMEYQQQRVDYLDRQDKAVTPESIKWPEKPVGNLDETESEKKKESTEPIRSSEISFRPPSGFATNPDPAPQKKIFLRYKSTDNKLPYEDIWIAAAKTSEPKKFRDDVRQRLKIKMEPEAYKTGLLGKELGRPVDFDYCFDDYGTRVYFRGEQGIQVAIVFRPARDATDEKLTAIQAKLDYSLPTLSLGSQAWRVKPVKK